MLRRFAAVVLLSATAVLSACDSGQASAGTRPAEGQPRDASPQAEAPAAEEALPDGGLEEQGTWREVGRWRGDGSKNTQSFAIRSREWRIAYAARQTEGSRAVWLGVNVSRAGERSSVTRASTRRAGADTTYVHEGPGRFYLEIASGGADWEIVVHDRQLPAERVDP